MNNHNNGAADKSTPTVALACNEGAQGPAASCGGINHTPDWCKCGPPRSLVSSAHVCCSYERVNMIRAKAQKLQRSCGHASACLCIALLLSLLAETAAGAERQTPSGVWMHANERIQVQIFSCGARLCGNIVWFRWPNDADGQPLVDIKNKNPALRSRPLLGLTVLRGLRRTTKNTWTGGRIYNPDDGRNYNVQMSIQDDTTLKVRAYSVVPAAGKTLIWTRSR